MKRHFPDYFRFGTSTSAYQIETAFEHDWLGHIARDRNIFNKTTDHEKRYKEDVNIISSLAPNYRMSLMWSRLQRSPFGAFEVETKKEYHQWFKQLKLGGVDIMLVLHHFANPSWFAKNGGWANRDNIGLWLDYARKVVNEFGDYISIWNTFNEPNLYATMGWIAGEFPPHKRNWNTAKKVIQNLSYAHGSIYSYIKMKHPDKMVGISHNCTVFAAENLLGWLPAMVCDSLYMEWSSKQFLDTDFFGISYYARVGFDPFPITYLETPEKLTRYGKKHDDIWEYYPQGLGKCIDRYWKKYRKPIIITENGICTNDDGKRVVAIHDYLAIVHDALKKGVDVRGYFHWSTWDNFEWSLGPTFKFGLYECLPETKQRVKKPSADVYSRIAYTLCLDTRCDLDR
jgi:beta-glucosidase